MRPEQPLPRRRWVRPGRPSGYLEVGVRFLLDGDVTVWIVTEIDHTPRGVATHIYFTVDRIPTPRWVISMTRAYWTRLRKASRLVVIRELEADQTPEALTHEAQVRRRAQTTQAGCLPTPGSPIPPPSPPQVRRPISD